MASSPDAAAEGRWNRNIHYHPRLIALGPADRVLDVGCGGGLLSRQLAGICTEVVGIDPDEDSIALARSETAESNVEFVLGDVLAYDFEGRSFDLIVSVAALHHMDVRAALSRFDELLAPGGRLGVVGIGRESFPRDIPRHVLAFASTLIYRVVHRKQLWHHSAPIVWPPPLTDLQVKRVAEEVLPGSEFRRLLQGRHSITWTKLTPNAR